MKIKLIASVLIYCFIFQIPFMNTGCTSFYPAAEYDSIADYKDYDGEIILKLKDNSEIEIPQHGIFYIEKDKIDSSRIVKDNSYFYHRFWMKGQKRLTFNLGKSPDLNPDTTGNFYYVMVNSKVFRQIYENDIVDIQIQKNDNTKTTLLIIGGICLIIAGFIFYAANEMRHMFDFHPTNKSF